jgi:uncharacterized protein
MSLVTPALLDAILNEYVLPPRGIHGITHWARVLENARRLAEQVPADPDVLDLFAVFHDSRRVNEAIDHGHGMRGSQLARDLRGVLFDMEDARFSMLIYACDHHTHGMTKAGPTVQVCWDADRLDLLRVAIRPSPERLCTEAARQPAILKWANARAVERAVPVSILQEWGFQNGTA